MVRLRRQVVAVAGLCVEIELVVAQELILRGRLSLVGGAGDDRAVELDSTWI